MNQENKAKFESTLEQRIARTKYHESRAAIVGLIFMVCGFVFMSQNLFDGIPHNGWAVMAAPIAAFAIAIPILGSFVIGWMFYFFIMRLRGVLSYRGSIFNFWE